MNFHNPFMPSEVNVPDLPTLEELISSGTRALLNERHSDGHWCFELEADATIPAEYILLVHYLGEVPDDVLEAKIGRYIRRIQGEHGGWPLHYDGGFDLSATVKAYFALKMIGDDPDAPHMARARAALLERGGADEANVFTRILLALFGETSWADVPTMPVELMLAPRWFPVHLSKMSYWARIVLVPLLVLQTLQPKARNPRGVTIRELFVPGRRRRASGPTHKHPGWARFFNGLDAALKSANGLWPKALRRRAIERARVFVVERLNGEDGLGGIFPAMGNAVKMFDALGIPADDPDRMTARGAIDKLLVINGDEAYFQPCVSPVWDTALAAHALLEIGGEEAEQAALSALEWLRPRQVLDVVGDWAEWRPDTRPGGWAFQYANPHYPDTDDTAVVVMAMDRARQRTPPGDAYDEAIERGAEWVAGLQSRNGGWGAFDADNTYEYLNNIPFADHGALLDQPTVDVTARCVGMMAQMGDADSPALTAALDFLEDEQEADGSWFGRWGVNYVYGTWSALCAFNAAGVDLQTPVVRRAVDWLVSIQNPDGGWGEDCDSYKLEYAGYEPAPSTASQTAWALLGLMAAGEVDHVAVSRGIAYLAETQSRDGLWPEDHYTGGGFPRVFYLRYHGYPKYFPLWAMARYRNLKRSNQRRVAYGI